VDNDDSPRVSLTSIGSVTVKTIRLRLALDRHRSPIAGRIATQSRDPTRCRRAALRGRHVRSWRTLEDLSVFAQVMPTPLSVDVTPALSIRRVA
jgi:hypothetical protein